ncbi:MAG: hypothetical protein ACYC3A_11805, partial [Halothiobacillus sp.]
MNLVANPSSKVSMSRGFVSVAWMLRKTLYSGRFMQSFTLLEKPYLTGVAPYSLGYTGPTKEDDRIATLL